MIFYVIGVIEGILLSITALLLLEPNYYWEDRGICYILTICYSIMSIFLFKGAKSLFK